MNPRPSPSLMHCKLPIRVTDLAFDLCVLYYRNLCTLTYSSLSSKITGKEGDCKSNSISSQWIICSPTAMGAMLSPNMFARPQCHDMFRRRRGRSLQGKCRTH